MKWEKLGHIFDPTAGDYGDFMRSHAQCPSVIVMEDALRVYFSCRPEPIDGQYLSYTAWLDLDPKDPTKVLRVAKKPVMQLGALGSFDEHGIYPTSTIRVKDEIFMYYGGWHRKQTTPYSVAIGLAKSKDGENFTRVYDGAFFNSNEVDPFEVSCPKIRNFGGRNFLFYLSGRGWTMHDGRAESLYKIRIAAYRDGAGWIRLPKDIIPDVLSDGECQAGADVFLKDGKYHMYFSYRHATDYRNPQRGYRIGYARSNDLATWERDDSYAGIELSKDGFDSEMMHYPHVFKYGSDHFMLYNGNDFGRYGLGLAKLIK